MTRKTSYTLREVANMLGLDIFVVRKHAARKILAANIKLHTTDLGKKRKKMKIRMFVVTNEALNRYKKYIRLKYKPRA